MKNNITLIHKSDRLFSLLDREKESRPINFIIFVDGVRVNSSLENSVFTGLCLESYRFLFQCQIFKLFQFFGSEGEFGRIVSK
jgi:hypothetical protein